MADASPLGSKYETIIGLEVHAQLLTKSKMYCGCSAAYASAAPNTHVDPVCLGLPGVLPVINRQAIEYTIMTGLALNCTIPPYTKFDRKNYPYPDLMKGYQISQYDAPLCLGGWLGIDVNGEPKRIGITRVHLEEDVAKLVHRTNALGESYSLVDVNRAGVPLMEIVSEPDMRSPEEARLYLVKLRAILQYLGVSTGNMEEGSFRCDANVSVRPRGTDVFLGKVEVKNMNSFRAVFRALSYEVERQIEIVDKGGTIPQETRGWVDDREVTVSQRSKEYAHDYRYFPEPDLPPLMPSREWVEGIRARLPELPEARRDRFMAELGLSRYDADLLTAGKPFADYFEQALAASSISPERRQERAKLTSNWMLGELNRLLNDAGIEAPQSRATPAHLSELLDLIQAGTISARTGKEVFAEMFASGADARQIVEKRGLTQVSGTGELADIVARVLADNPQAVADYQSGKEQALKFLVGQVMKETRGRANPQVANTLIVEELKSRG